MSEITIQDIIKLPNKDFMNYFRREVYAILKKAELNIKIYIAFINEFLNEIDKRIGD